MHIDILHQFSTNNQLKLTQNFVLVLELFQVWSVLQVVWALN